MRFLLGLLAYPLVLCCWLLFEAGDIGFDPGDGKPVIRRAVQPPIGPDEPPLPPEDSDSAPVKEHKEINWGASTVIAESSNNLILVKYEKRKWPKGDEDFPRFHFEPMVGDFVYSDAGVEYQISKRSYNWMGKPNRSQTALTLWLLRCKSVNP